ncbi:hypothetical protein [Kitasatospora sp. NPDC089509]|uniref:hypothetical protein n=1 Tax=Kitasatospora sp. NPDC089509 TaxID=3364079 RepID=UPI0037F2A589
MRRRLGTGSGGAEPPRGVEPERVAGGDTLVLPTDVPRRLATAEGFTAVVASASPSHAYNPDARTPEGACGLAPRDVGRLLPPWIA